MNKILTITAMMVLSAFLVVEANSTRVQATFARTSTPSATEQTELFVQKYPKKAKEQAESLAYNNPKRAEEQVESFVNQKPAEAKEGARIAKVALENAEWNDPMQVTAEIIKLEKKAMKHKKATEKVAYSAEKAGAIYTPKKRTKSFKQNERTRKRAKRKASL
jgi:hypothetical protein